MPLAAGGWKVMLLALCTLALVAAVPQAASATQSERTLVRFVSPFTNKHALKRADVITQTVRGECLGASPIGGSHTSECLVRGSKTGYAVCWSTANKPAKYALCSNDIRSDDYVKVLVNRPPVTFANVKLIWPSSHEAAPIAVTLTTGQFCSEAPGSPDRYQGQSVRYLCQNSGLALLNDADTKRSTWTFATVIFANGKGTFSSPASVYKAWFTG